MQQNIKQKNFQDEQLAYELFLTTRQKAKTINPFDRQCTNKHWCFFG